MECMERHLMSVNVGVSSSPQPTMMNEMVESMRCRHVDVAGDTCFSTVNLAERQRTLLVDHVDMLRNVIRQVKETM